MQKRCFNFSLDMLPPYISHFGSAAKNTVTVRAGIDDQVEGKGPCTQIRRMKGCHLLVKSNE